MKTKRELMGNQGDDSLRQAQKIMPVNKRMPAHSTAARAPWINLARPHHINCCLIVSIGSQTLGKEFAF
jgi:hypothetical protein